jgi:hypothetical protein
VGHQRPRTAPPRRHSLALGIGANTAIFSLVSSTLQRPLPFETPERDLIDALGGCSGSLVGCSYGGFIAPTLLLIGEHKQLYVPATLELAKRRMPGLTGAVIAGAHHIAALAQPEDVNRRILEFLRAGTPTRG